MKDNPLMPRHKSRFQMVLGVYLNLDSFKKNGELARVPNSDV